MRAATADCPFEIAFGSPREHGPELETAVAIHQGRRELRDAVAALLCNEQARQPERAREIAQLVLETVDVHGPGRATLHFVEIDSHFWHCDWIEGELRDLVFDS